MTDLRVDLDGAERHVGQLVDHVKSLGDVVKSAKRDMHDLMAARDEKMADLEDEVSRYGSEFAETKARIDDLSSEFASRFGELQGALDSIDEMSARLNSSATSLASGDRKDAIRAEALEFFEVKHLAEHGKRENMPEFDASSVSEDEIEQYATGKKAFEKMFRAKANVQNAMNLLSVDEQKAIATYNYGSEMMLPIELSNKLIECWEDDTQFENAFDILTIGKEAVQLMVDYDEPEIEGAWNCEADCAPKPGIDPIEMGVKTFVTGELRTEHCVTNRMLEDSEIDIPSMLVDSVARKFQKLERRSYMIGDGVQKPDGILNDGNHIDFLSNVTGTLGAGEFGWQDLVALYWKFPDQFRSQTSWWFHEDALVKLFTLTDADGNPVMQQNAFAQSGLPRLMGKEVRENTYMPNYIDNDPASATYGQPIIGSKPVALGNWREGYLRVNRKGFSVLRDPYSKIRCGVVWHFTRRLGGGVKCPNAMWFLKIQ